jgi:hypothetical protein
MRLDQLEWKASRDRPGAEYAYRQIDRVLWCFLRWPDGTYSLQRTGHAWTEKLDPIEAQCILYELIGGRDIGAHARRLSPRRSFEHSSARSSALIAAPSGCLSVVSQI